MAGVYPEGEDVPAAFADLVEGQSSDEAALIPRLDFAHAELKAFPRAEIWAPFASITALDLSHNHLERLPKDLAARGALSNLTELSLAHNRLSSTANVAAALAPLRALGALDLRGNPLPTIANRVYLLAALLRPGARSYLARHDSAEDFSRLNAILFTAMASIFIPAYCFAIP